MSPDALPDLPGDDAGFQTSYDFLNAADRLRDGSRAVERSALIRAEHVTRQTFNATQRQILRIRSADLTEQGAARQATMDAQFLIAGLWLLRRAAVVPASHEPPPPVGR